MQIRFQLPILLLFLTLAGCKPAAEATGLVVPHDLRIEGKVSSTRQVPILVLFMSNTCPYCEIVLQDFLLPMQRDSEYDNKVILRQIETSNTGKLIDFDGNPTTYNAFARKHKVWGVPEVMLFDGQGHVLTSIKGLLTVDFYLAYLDNAINESQAKIKAQ